MDKIYFVSLHYKIHIAMYYKRNIDDHLLEWSKRDVHKPLLLRGARQVGKSTAIRHLGEQFESYVEINFERNPEYKALFWFGTSYAQYDFGKCDRDYHTDSHSQRC